MSHAEAGSVPDLGIAQGVLEVDRQGRGTLRDLTRNLRIAPNDPTLDRDQIAKAKLKPGHLVGYRRLDAEGRPLPVENRTQSKTRDASPRASRIELCNVEGQPIGTEWTPFSQLTAIDPTKQIRLETGPEPFGSRVIDLLCPIGCGQRGLIVAPPRSGKTILLQEIARAVSTNHPEITLFLLLVDERPEEVTEVRRGDHGGIVLASSNDQDSEDHIRLAELTFERARRIVETGGDVLILLDSLTRLARAYNKDSHSGRTMTGGLDIRAMDTPKRLFGTARACDEGGSLTVLATSLVETGSRMDDLIFLEFQGTGNMELILNRSLAERRLWPAIDIPASGTRKEERLLDPETLEKTHLLRRTLGSRSPVEAIEALRGQLEKHPTNAELLQMIGQVQSSARRPRR